MGHEFFYVTPRPETCNNWTVPFWGVQSSGVGWRNSDVRCCCMRAEGFKQTPVIVFYTNEIVITRTWPLETLKLGKSDDRFSDRKFTKIPPKCVTLQQQFSNLSRIFRKSHRSDGAQKFQLQQAHSVCCNWNFWTPSNRWDLWKTLYKFENSVTLFPSISFIFG